MFKLTDKIAIVTGASRGIGKSIAETLEKAGAQVMCVSRHLEDVQKIADNLGNAGSEAMGFACDVSDTKSVTSLVQSIIEKYHRISSLTMLELQRMLSSCGCQNEIGMMF